MKINFDYSKSYLSRGLNFLFGPKDFFNLAESRLGRLLLGINYPSVAEAMVAISIFLLFYKDLLAKYVSFNFGNLIPIFLIAALVLADKKKLTVSKLHLWLMSFYILLLASGFIAIFNGLNPKMILLGWLLFFQFLLAIWAGQGIGKSKANMTVIALAMPAALYGIWQYVTGAANSRLWFSSFENLNATRAFAWFGTPNVFGIVMAFVAALSLFELLAKRKLVYGLTLAISLFGLFASLSRSAWIGFALAAAISLVILNYKYLFFAPLALVLFLSASIRNRIFALVNPKYIQDSSLDGRVWAASNGIYIWSKNFLFGFGPGSYGGQLAQSYASPVYLLGQQNGYTPIYFTDNQWLEILVQGGILGLISFAGFLVASFWQIIHNFKAKKEIVFLGSLSVLIIFAFSGFAANVLEFGAVAIPAGLVIGSALNEA